MEGLLALVGVVLAIWLFNVLLRGFVGTVSAAGRTVLGKGNFSENMELQFKGMQQFAIRTSEVKKGHDGAPFDHIKIEGKGLIPVSTRTKIAFVTSVFDVTGDEKKPVGSVVEDFQEPETIAFQHSVDGGEVEPNQGFASWVRVGIVIPDILVPPRGGDRRLMVVTRIVDTRKKLTIKSGLQEKNDTSVLIAVSQTIAYRFSAKGYEEEAEQRDRANALAVELAVAVAMADGDMAEEEAKIISKWIQKIISPYSGSRREALKEACNSTLKRAFLEGRNGTISISRITNAINDGADDSMKHQAIELCLDVMAADGVAGATELSTIRKVAEALNFDYAELQRLKDQRMISIQADISSHGSLEDMLGIDLAWTPDQIKKHLRTEFAKWNGRINTLSDPEEKKNTQKMLDMIAEARKKYG